MTDHDLRRLATSLRKAAAMSREDLSRNGLILAAETLEIIANRMDGV